MVPSHDRAPTPSGAEELEQPVADVENALAALGLALHRQDANGVVQAADGLHRALARAVTHVSRAAREGGVPQELRQRLALASGQVAAQREALARATASLDRAIDVLMPGLHAGPAAGLYSAGGLSDRASGRGSLMA